MKLYTKYLVEHQEQDINSQEIQAAALVGSDICNTSISRPAKYGVHRTL
jgi:hypothetical protein